MRCSQCGSDIAVVARSDAKGGPICMPCLSKEVTARANAFLSDRKSDYSAPVTASVRQPGVLFFRKATAPRPRRVLRRG